MNDSMAKINRIIQQEIDSGIPANRIVLGGFGQGGVMALFTGLQSEDQLAGIVMMSGYLPIRDRIMAMTTKVSKHIPIFQSHGALDRTIPFHYGEMASQTLRENGYNIEFHTGRHSEHDFQDNEIYNLHMFLAKVL
ncbi:hypothetical protein GGF42_006106 [Coemansia sp. RSA 2424]|nr:hypothetical protein GGF42_006106 [Coemansia sp. RSA 2424]